MNKTGLGLQEAHLLLAIKEPRPWSMMPSNAADAAVADPWVLNDFDDEEDDWEDEDELDDEDWDDDDDDFDDDDDVDDVDWREEDEFS